MQDSEYDLPPPDAGWQKLGKSPFTDLSGPFFSTSQNLGSDEPIRIGFRVAPKHCNGIEICHGGMMATFLDMALGLAVRAGVKNIGPSPTMNMTVDFLSAAVVGDWIESRSRLVHTTYKSAFIDTVALGPKGPVARANGIFRLSRPK